MKKILLISMVIMTVVILSGCQKAAEKTAEKIFESTTDGQVDVDDDTVTLNINDSSLVIGENATIPDDFPSDVYVIDGNILSSLTMDEDSTFQVQIETSESYDSTVSTYEDELVSEGWDIVANLTIGEATTMSAEKNNRTTTVSISESDDMTIVTITTSVVSE